jgi:cardiolipin synthase (CMP-forming)
MNNLQREKENIFVLPNLLSFYRVIIFPVILYFIIKDKEMLFALFIILNLVTDFLDGFIARKFNLQTEFGARLDSMGDNLTYVLAFAGILVFKTDELRPHLISFLSFLFLSILMVIISLIKFRRFSSFHLYSFKTGGYIKGMFFITLFFYGFITPFYYLMITWAILSAIEHITIQLIIPEMRSNIKGLYWVLMEREKKKRLNKYTGEKYRSF